jgi:hypothetical protein
VCGNHACHQACHGSFHGKSRPAFFSTRVRFTKKNYFLFKRQIVAPPLPQRNSGLVQLHFDFRLGAVLHVARGVAKKAFSSVQQADPVSAQLVVGALLAQVLGAECAPHGF